MNPNKGDIGLRELVSLIIIIIGIKAVDTTPLSLFKLGKNATWMMPIIWLSLLAFSLFFTFKLLKHYQDKNILEIIMIIIGKYGGTFLNFYLFIIAFAASIDNTRSYVDIMKITIFKRTPTIVLLASLILVSGYIAYKGIHSITRTSLVVIPIFIFGAILLNILMIDSFNYLYIFPFAGPGLKKVGLRSLTTFTFIFEYFYLGIIIKKVKDYKTYRNANIIGFTIALLYMSMMFMNYIFVLDYYETEHMTHVFSQIIRMTNIGVFINNLEAIYFSLWTAAGMIRFAFYIYISAIILGFILKIQEKDSKYLILSLCIIILIIGLIPNNLFETEIQFRDQMLIKYNWLAGLILPFVLWVIALLRGKFRNAKA